MGFYDYLFAIQLEIDLSKSGIENQVVKTIIINGKNLEMMKNWWRSYIETYKLEAKYAKKHIADKYELVPPPPPPPASKEWY